MLPLANMKLTLYLNEMNLVSYESIFKKFNIGLEFSHIIFMTIFEQRKFFI